MLLYLFFSPTVLLVPQNWFKNVDFFNIFVKSNKKKDFVKKKKNLNNLNTYLTRKIKKNQKVHFSKLIPVSQNLSLSLQSVIYRFVICIYKLQKELCFQ